MKTLLLIGRSGCGKTTLARLLTERAIDEAYIRTQSVIRDGFIIDTPGEYAESQWAMGTSLTLFAYEADAVAFVIAADEPYSLFPPYMNSRCNREVIGVVTKSDLCPTAQAEQWLRLAGCRTIFSVSINGTGVAELEEWLSNSLLRGENT